MSGVVSAKAAPIMEHASAQCGDCQLVPDLLGGTSLEALREDYRRRLFEHFLPFWEKGGYDRQRGGFTCELNDDGSIASDDKFIWYQGRAIWVYAFLHHNFGRDPHWLDVATRTRDFMVQHMYAGKGQWVEKVRRDGTVLSGVGKTIYGWLFAATGLAQYAIATDSRGRSSGMTARVLSP
jgi:mannose/cellobiose epimerase-like protein (N-acyl-D-glucosamine 2-epimerase family)